MNKLINILIVILLLLTFATATTTAAAPVIKLLNFSPTAVYTNYTGQYTMSYGITHDAVGLNYTSVAFVFGLNYTIDDSYSNSIRVPSNEIAATIPAMSTYGNIFRDYRRNATPFLTWKDNTTMTDGDIWKYGGLDYNDAAMVLTAVNDTYSFINITGSHITSHGNMHYLDAISMFTATKTDFEISKSNSLITKVWNTEKINNRNDDYIIHGYFDTSVNSGSVPTKDINIWHCNCSYDPLTDFDGSPYCEIIETWNSTRWVDHTFIPRPGATYTSPLVQAGDGFNYESCGINYVIYQSNAVSSKPYLLRMTNIDPDITNLTFAQTGTAWSWSEIGGSSTPYAYTPATFYTYTRDYEQLEIQLYISDNNNLWNDSGVYSQVIGGSHFPVSAVGFDYFNVSCGNGYTFDELMDGTYDDGSLYVALNCPADPDGGNVTHNLTLHYSNQTYVGIINNTFTTTGIEKIEINFSTSTYYSSCDAYTLRCVSTDEEGSVATKWLGSNFTLASDGSQGYFKNDMLLFWGMNNIPTLYSVINDTSLISYNTVDDIYTMHVPFFKSKYNDTFRFNETVHLESLNNEDVAHFRFSGSIIFDNANIHAWNTSVDTIAPDTDEYRGYIISFCDNCGNITNCNMSYLGSDVYQQEGVNFRCNLLDYLIYNTTFSHNSRGIIFEECENVNISHCSMYDNDEVGIGIYYTSNITIDYTNIFDNGRAGIRLYEARNNLIEDCTMDSNVRHGIRLDNCDNNTFDNCSITDSGRYGIYVIANSHNTTISNSSINGAGLGYDGIIAASVNDLIISNTTITNIQESGNDITIGADCINITIQDLYDVSDRIKVWDSAEVKIINTDNKIFTDTSAYYTAYAYPANFSMSTSGTLETFDIKQYDIKLTPDSGTVEIGLASASTDSMEVEIQTSTANSVWINATRNDWIGHSDIGIFENGTHISNLTADGNGKADYNFTNFSVSTVLSFTTDWVTGTSVLLSDVTFVAAIGTAVLAVSLFVKKVGAWVNRRRKRW